MTTARRIYLDGNSLGPPAPGTADAVGALVDEWERELIGGWDLLRFGFAPLYVTDDDVDEAFDRLSRILRQETWRRWVGASRPTVI